MPDLIGHLSMITERNKKRHLAWVEMPLRRISNVISHDAGAHRPPTKNYSGKDVEMFWKSIGYGAPEEY